MVERNSMKIGIFTSKKKSNVETVAPKLFKILQDNGYEPIIVDENSLRNDLSAIFTVGGDGTVLALADFLNNNDVPVVCINGGHFGFLAEFEADELEQAVTLFKNGELIKDERIMLKIACENNVYYAINEVVLQRSFNEEQDERLAEVDVEVDGTPIERIKGDGVIVSTATGSTAYSLSAGGSILSPAVKALSITPICAHSLYNRPIVVSGKSNITLSPIRGSSVALYVDGKRKNKFLSGKVEVVSAEARLQFLRKTNSNFYQKLFSKFRSKDLYE